MDDMAATWKELRRRQGFAYHYWWRFWLCVVAPWYWKSGLPFRYQAVTVIGYVARFGPDPALRDD